MVPSATTVGPAATLAGAIRRRPRRPTGPRPGGPAPGPARTAPARRSSGASAHGGQHDQGDLRRRTEADRAVRVGRGDGDDDDLGQERQHRHLAPAQADEAGDGAAAPWSSTGRAPSRLTHRGRPSMLASSAFCSGRNTSHTRPTRAATTTGSRPGGRGRSRSRRPASTAPSATRRPGGSPPLLADALLAVEQPVAEELAVVGLVAVRVDLQLAAVGGQRHRGVEADGVADLPRRDDHQRGHDRRERHEDLRLAGQPAVEGHPRARRGRPAGCSPSPRTKAESPIRRAEQRGRWQRRSSAPAVGHEDGQARSGGSNRPSE